MCDIAGVMGGEMKLPLLNLVNYQTVAPAQSHFGVTVMMNDSNDSTVNI